MQLSGDDISWIKRIVLDAVADRIETVAARYANRGSHDGDLVADALAEIAVELKDMLQP